MRLVSR